MGKKQVWDYTLYIKGLFGRNRTVKFEGFPVVKRSESQLSLEDLQAATDAAIAKAKIKGQAIVKLVELKMEIEKHDGYETMTFGLGNSVTLMQKVVGV